MTDEQLTPHWRGGLSIGFFSDAPLEVGLATPKQFDNNIYTVYYQVFVVPLLYCFTHPPETQKCVSNES